MEQRKHFKVELKNIETVGAYCGFGEGKTLKQAQDDALKKAREYDPCPVLSPNGYIVSFCGGVNR